MATERPAPKPATTTRGMPGFVGPRTFPGNRPAPTPTPPVRRETNEEGDYEAGKVGPRRGY